MYPPFSSRLRRSFLILSCLLLLQHAALYGQAGAPTGASAGPVAVSPATGGTQAAISRLGKGPGGIYYSPDSGDAANPESIGEFSYGRAGFRWTLPEQSILRDERFGQFTTMSSSPRLSPYGVGWNSNLHVCIFENLPGWTPTKDMAHTNAHAQCLFHLNYNSVPGFDYGAPGTPPSIGWFSSATQTNRSYFWSQGIHVGVDNSGYCGGVGDCNWWGQYVKVKPAHTAGSDEGFREFQFNVAEVDPFTGVVAGVNQAGPGETRLQLKRTGGDGENFGLGVGHPVIDTGAANQVTEAANASEGSTIYTGTFPRGDKNGLAHGEVVVSGFHNDSNNGSFQIESSTATTIKVNNRGGMKETLSQPYAKALLNVIRCSDSSFKGTSTYGTVTVKGCDLPVSTATGKLDSAFNVPQSIDGVPALVEVPLSGLSQKIQAGDTFSVWGRWFVESGVVTRVVEDYKSADKTEKIEVPLRYTHSKGDGWCVGGAAGRWLEVTKNSSGNFRYFFSVVCSSAPDTMTVAIANTSGQIPTRQINGPVNLMHGGILLDVRDPAAAQNAVTGDNLAVTTQDASTFAPGTTILNSNDVVGWGGGVADKYAYENHNPYAFLAHESVAYLGLGTNTQLISDRWTNAGGISRYVNSGGGVYAANWLWWDGALGEAMHLQYEPQGAMESGLAHTGTIIHVGGRAPGSTNPYYDIWEQGGDYIRWTNSDQRLTLHMGDVVSDGELDEEQRFVARTNGNARNTGYFWYDKNGLPDQRTWGARIWGGQWHLGAYDDTTTAGPDAITIQAKTGQVDLAAPNATVHGVKICDANGNNCPGVGGPVTIAAGNGVRSASCMDTTGTAIQCSSARGSIRIVAGTATTGPLASLRWSTEGSARVCQVTQNGGTTFYGLGHTAPNATGFAITAAANVAGATIDLDYMCSR